MEIEWTVTESIGPCGYNPAGIAKVQIQMSSNKIQINDSDSLSWELSDELADALVALLDGITRHRANALGEVYAKETVSIEEFLTSDHKVLRLLAKHIQQNKLGNNNESSSISEE